MLEKIQDLDQIRAKISSTPLIENSPRIPIIETKPYNNNFVTLQKGQPRIPVSNLFGNELKPENVQNNKDLKST